MTKSSGTIWGAIATCEATAPKREMLNANSLQLQLIRYSLRLDEKNMTKDYDVIILGAGPAGYVAAIRCAQLGLNTAVVDNWIDENGEFSLGGTCLNVGCIPSKALLESSELFEKIQNESNIHGISCNHVVVDIATMQQRKNGIVSDLTKGIADLFKANKITWIKATGELQSKKVLKVTDSNNQTSTISAHSIILASGSSPVQIPAAKLYKQQIVDSTGALNWQNVPKSIAIIGAGVIGLELGSVWRRLGAKVIMLEAQTQFLPMVDAAIAKRSLSFFKKQGLDIHLDARVLSTTRNKNSVDIEYQDAKGNQKITVERVIVAVGRKPNTENIAHIDAHLEIDEDGCVHIDETRGGTSIPGVYAIGDIVRGPMLAHKASEEGIAVAQRIAGLKSYVNYNVIPSIIYTHPEIAMVGKTEEQVKQTGEPYKVGSFPFAANGRAKAMQATQGFVKIISHQKSDRILGVHILGVQASELIGQAVIAMEFEASTEDLIETIFAHPTLSESIHEAAMNVDKRAVHLFTKK